jgi:NAD(P)-dependent dehydrogenase (short-subunit alcohol dehydrogenase family)
LKIYLGCLEIKHFVKLRGKVAIITGGSRGIGYAIASRFASEGAKVVIVSVSEGRAEEAAMRIREMGGDATGLRGDVTSRERMGEIVSYVISEFKAVDILVNNAGVHDGKAFCEESLELWDRMYRVNVIGVVIPSQAVVPHMMRRKEGKIINVSSKAAVVGEPGHSAYSASKGAVLALTRAMAVELAPYNIKVNAICPGPTVTDMLLGPSRSLSPQQEEFKKWIPLGRFGKPEDIAGAALYLASEDSDWCTGQAVVVDGGLSVLK